MAIWQFDAHLINSTSSMQVDVKRLPEVDITHDCAEALISLFGSEIEAWTDSIRSYGTDDGSRLDFVYEDDRLVELFLRLDIRKKDYGFIERLAYILSENNLSLVLPSGSVLIPEKAVIITAINAFIRTQFANSPFPPSPNS